MLIPCSISYQHNTDMRKYIGAFEISGNTWRVYHDAGQTDLNTTSGAATQRYYVQDYLGSTRAVVDLYGNLEQTNVYNLTGIPSSRHLGKAILSKLNLLLRSFFSTVALRLR